jgi:hypothetical protein
MQSVAALLLLMAASAATSPCPEPSSPELRKLVLPSMKAETTTQIKPWKKDLCVALVQTGDHHEEQAYAVAVFATGNGSLSSRMKATTGPIDLAHDESISGLDLAKYEVSETQTAIGVRITRERPYTGGRASVEILVLYLPRAGRLAPILTTFMSYQAELAGDWKDDGTREHVHYEGKSTLVVDKTKTEGHFDLTRKTKHGTQHLRWQGSAYVAVEKDPFAKEDLEILEQR